MTRRLAASLLLLPWLLAGGVAQAAPAKRSHHPGPRPVASAHPRAHAVPPHAAARLDRPDMLIAKPLVVIDPGHGGSDPGAVGLSGSLEKNVTLATALELRRQLLATGRYRVELTRQDDRFVSLPARLGFARTHDASLLIAIHADSSPDHQAHGASVYVRTAAAGGTRTTRVAASPRNSHQIANSLSGAGAAPMPAAVRLQDSLIDNLDDEIRMVADPSRQARFFVLGAAEMPSVLLEMGFLSNRREEALLLQPGHRKRIAEALRDAVNDYFDQRPAAART